MLRGNNPSHAHIDLQLRGCNVWLDKNLVIKAGKLTS
jgi:hypothetical protein